MIPVSDELLFTKLCWKILGVGWQFFLGWENSIWHDMWYEDLAVKHFPRFIYASM